SGSERNPRLFQTKHSRTLGRVRGVLDTLSGCGSRVVGVFQGYAKNAYPWLIYLHRSAVRSLHACLTMWTGQMQMNNAGKRALTRWLAPVNISTVRCLQSSLRRFSSTPD